MHWVIVYFIVVWTNFELVFYFILRIMSVIQLASKKKLEMKFDLMWIGNLICQFVSVDSSICICITDISDT
jgi:hypothetical protein